MARVTQWTATNKPMMLISTPPIAAKKPPTRAGQVGPVQKANEAPPDASLRRCRSRPALRFQRPIARRAPETPRAMRLPFACQLSMTVPFRPVLLLADYSIRGTTRRRSSDAGCPLTTPKPKLHCRRHPRQSSRAGGYPSLESGHHGTKLGADGSHPTTQTERSESFETA